MASIEYLHYEADCPCGQGTLRRELDSPNYPFGLGRITHVAIVCSHCLSQWQMTSDGGLLWHTSRTNHPAMKAKVDKQKIRALLMRTLHELKETALREKLQAAGALSKAAEHRHLQSIGLFSGGYSSYRNQGLSAAANKINPAAVPACMSVLAQLHDIDTAIQALEQEYAQWFNAHADQLKFVPAWRSV